MLSSERCATNAASTGRDYRNGHYTRDLDTTVGHLEDLPVPRTRGGYQTQLFERYHRRRGEVDQAIGEMFIGGVSMGRVGEVTETLMGIKPSASTVSRVFHSLESEYEQWKKRKLAERYVYAFADGTYFTVIYNGEGCKMPILAVVGIAQTGERGCWPSAWGIAKMNRLGRTCSLTSKIEGQDHRSVGQ